jgi:hypothetical protein
MMCASGCIEPYFPGLTGGSELVYVVSGEVTDQEGFQNVDISSTSPVGEPQYIPVKGCEATIEDDKGNTFRMEENEAGKYRTWMDRNSLMPGTSYRLLLVTPSGESIISDFDQMPVCPAIDSVYCMRKEKLSRNSGITLTGLQFNVDFHGSDPDSQYYRWTVDETWEYHTPYPIENYYDGSMHEVYPHDYRYNVCWSSEPVKSIFTLSTIGLASNRFSVPLHFVDNTTNRLFVGYSVLITQHALSAPAYVFWDQLRINSEQEGGLYEKQPLPVQGNLRNITNPGTKVLGFFGASSITQKRIFLDAVRDMGVTDGYMCAPHPLYAGGWMEFSPSDYPVYYKYFDFNLMILDNICVDCRVFGGSLTKPDFWPR